MAALSERWLLSDGEREKWRAHLFTMSNLPAGGCRRSEGVMGR